MSKNLPKAWTDWARELCRSMADKGLNIQAGTGVVLQIDKAAKTMTILCETPEYHGSREERLNRQTFAAVGYIVVRPDNVTTDLESFLDLIEEKMDDDKKVSIIDNNSVEQLADMFRRPPSEILEMLNQRKTVRKGKEPINPITLYGGYIKLTIQRLWWNDGTLREGQHRWGKPGQEGEWNKTMTFMLWTGDGHNPQHIAHTQVEEGHFINQIKLLKTGCPKVWLTEEKLLPSGDILHPIGLTLEKVGDRLQIAWNDGNLDFDYEYVEAGLGHLFVKGELHPVSNN